MQTVKMHEHFIELAGFALKLTKQVGKSNSVHLKVCKIIRYEEQCSSSSWQNNYLSVHLKADIIL